MRRLGRIIKSLLTVILLLSFLIFLVISLTHSNTERTLYKSTAVLNVRTGAGTGYPVLFTLQKGVEVEVISTKNREWYYIRYSGKKGYAYSEYLEYNREVLKGDSKTRLKNFQKTRNNFFKGLIALLLLLAVYALFRKIHNNKLIKSVTCLRRGTSSERDLVLKLLKYGISPQMIFHDLYLRKGDGKFSQIDVVAVTDVGIIVFEVKDFSGWIFGNGNNYEWTKVLAYGKQKHHFYNPIMQNNKHISVLKKSLMQAENLPFYSIVLFYGNCVLKDVSFIPKGTYIVKPKRFREVMNIIMKNNEPIHYSYKEEMLSVLQKAVENGANKEIQTRHTENIKDMIGKDRIFD